jgi:hypothetical protein
LAHEAWFYEELEHIQGVVIAHCYGFFTAEVDPNSELLGWMESDEVYDPNDEVDKFADDEDGDNVSPATENTPSRIGTDIYGDNTMKKECSVEPTQSASNGDKNTFVSVLVLERLSGPIPRFVSIDPIKYILLSDISMQNSSSPYSQAGYL